MRYSRYAILNLLLFFFLCCDAQVDSGVALLQGVPVKFLHVADKKIDQYSSRITGKTEKTLMKLSRWENKIKALLEKASPETAQKLFGNNQLTFTTALQKFRAGEAVVTGYRAKYNAYRDKLNTRIKYLEQEQEILDRKFIKPVKDVKHKLTELEADVSNTEAAEQFIKERRKQLLNEAVKYIGKSRYLAKIDKEAFYYAETIRNYKELFSDSRKAEALAIKLLNKIPAFKQFAQENSMLATLFRYPGGGGGGGVTSMNVRGLQTRQSVNALMQARAGGSGPGVQQQMNQSFQQAQTELNKLKDKILKAGGGGSDANIPDFKPNMQKTRTFLQRLEYGSILDFDKAGGYIPAIVNIGVRVGYKLNDKSIAGIGFNYKMGLGNLQKIHISHQGIGLRSFLDWKLKKQFFVTGGFELNYNATFSKIVELKNYDTWQQAGLVGLTKKIPIKTKWSKETHVHLLYDMLYRQHVPVSQPVILRVGYAFK